MSVNLSRFAVAILLAASAVTMISAPLEEQETAQTMTLADILQTARTANAALQVPGFGIAIAEQKRREALSLNKLKVLLGGDVIFAPSSGYDPIVTNLGEERAQVIVTRPILDSGARSAQIAAANAGLAGAHAQYRIAERDLELDVRNNYIDARNAMAEVAARRGGITQLRDYRLLLESRRAAGLPVAPEMLRIDVRIAGEEASILLAEARHRQAVQALNDLMGRTPTAPLDLAPLPPLPAASAVNEGTPPSQLPPSPGASSIDGVVVATPSLPAGESPQMVISLAEGSPSSGAEGSAGMLGLPETASALAGVRSAEANLLQVRAEHGFKLDLSADAGLWGSDTSHLVPPDLGPGATIGDRIQRDLGYSLMVGFSLPLRDRTYAPRLAQARLGVDQAQQSLAVAERNARLQQSQARAALRDILREIELIRSTVASARDAWLESKSLYLGGAVPFVDVTDTFASWIDSELRLADAERRYREAEALLLRWTATQ